MTLQIVELVSLCNHYISKPNGQFCPLESGFLVASDRNPPQTGLRKKKKKAIKNHSLPPTSVILPDACLTGGSGPHWGTVVPSKASSERNRGSSCCIVPTETPG